MAKIWYLGHSCFVIEIDGVKILTDPFIMDNPLAKNIALATIDADIILVSHGHGDHISDLLLLAKQTKAMVVSNFEITTWVEKQGYQKVHPMNIGGNKRFNSVEVKMVNAIHSSSFPDGSYAGNPGGFVIKGEKESVYFAGDTSLHFDMKLIAEEFALAAAILPLGDNFTMGVDDAVKAAKWVNCNRIIGMHYNTFGYIQIDEAQAIQKFKSEGMQLDLMTIGSRIEVETNILTSK